MRDKMKFKKMFENNFKMAILGFIGGYVVYFMSTWSEIIKNKVLLGIITFLITIILVWLYTFSVWFFDNKKIKIKK